MTVLTAIEWGLLAVGVGAELIAALGILAMRSPFTRLHFQATASTIGPVAIAIAVIVRFGPSAFALKAVLFAILLAAGGPVMTHALGRLAAVERGVSAGAMVEREMDRD
jgi:monovalent cation/proton antiporter MnhG/PhaG subunit